MDSLACLAKNMEFCRTAQAEIMAVLRLYPDRFIAGHYSCIKIDNFMKNNK